jgi:hypothetical protein
MLTAGQRLSRRLPRGLSHDEAKVVAESIIANKLATVVQWPAAIVGMLAVNPHVHRVHQRARAKKVQRSPSWLFAVCE